MQELRYKYLGVEDGRITVDQAESQRRVTDRQVTRLIESDQEAMCDNDVLDCLRDQAWKH